MNEVQWIFSRCVPAVAAAPPAHVIAIPDFVSHTSDDASRSRAKAHAQARRRRRIREHLAREMRKNKRRQALAVMSRRDAKLAPRTVAAARMDPAFSMRVNGRGVCPAQVDAGQPQDSDTLFGVSRAQVDQIYEAVAAAMRAQNVVPKPTDRRAFFSSYCCIAGGVSWGELSELQSLWLRPGEPAVDSLTLQNDFKRVVHLLTEFPVMNPELRFLYRHPSLPAVTALVTDALMSVRTPRGVMHLSAVVWTTLNGLPIFCHSVSGATCRDATPLLQSGPSLGKPSLPTHARGECWLADTGCYIGCGHVVPPYSATTPNEQLSEEQLKFNERHSFFRSRTEALLDRLRDTFDCFRYCEFDDPQWLEGALRLALTALYVVHLEAPSYNDCILAASRDEVKSRFSMRACPCARGADAHRDVVAAALRFARAPAALTCASQQRRRERNEPTTAIASEQQLSLSEQPLSGLMAQWFQDQQFLSTYLLR